MEKCFRFQRSEIDQAVFKRSMEIRLLVDKKQMEAKENVKKNKMKQIKTQETAKLKLDIGSQVYISTVGMNDKLYNRYRGPFTIVRISRSGNYVIKNVLVKS